MIRRLLALGAALALSGAADPERAKIEAEAIPLLRELIRLDTTNPPGNEGVAAKAIAAWLAREGIESEIAGPSPDRGSLVARLKGDGVEPPLMLLSHLDVVPADADKWRHPPFAAEIHDGAIWGRGSIDTKSLTVMQLLAFAELKRQAVPLRRDVILCAVADEEAGGHQGAGWLLENRPDLVRASEIWNEGGGGMIFPTGRSGVGIVTAERGHFWARVVARGRPGHGSIERPDGATRRLVRALARLEATPRPSALVPEAREFLKVLGPVVGGFGGWMVENMDLPGMLPLFGPRLAAINPALGSWVTTSVNTTVLDAGSKVNVMPAEAAAEVDMRLLPGFTPDDARHYLETALADPDIEIQVLSRKNSTRSEASGPLYEAMVAAVREEYPQAAVGKMLAGWGTDCAHFRSPETKCFGLNPEVLTPEQVASFHGHDERLTIDQLVAGTRVVIRAARQAAMR